MAWRRILHVHRFATALTAHLQPKVGHVTDCSAPGARPPHSPQRAHSPDSPCSPFLPYDGVVLTPIVLAAGGSTRMGTPKALLRDRDGRPFVTRIVRTLRDAGFNEVTVVTATPSHDAIVDALAADGAAVTRRFAINRHPDRGQLSSLWSGMDVAIVPNVTAILVTLVDVPFVTSQTVRAVVDAYLATGAAIVRPAHGDRHGHPVIFDRVLFDELRRADPATGAKAVVRGHFSQVLDVPVEDEGAFLDIDTPGDYHNALGSL